ncbi:hypothetical protein JOQ06_016248, partial [Pogonophryne albipinna]
YQQLPALLLHLDISPPPSATSSNSCDLLFVSSHDPGGLLGSRSLCQCSSLSLPYFF